MEGKEAHSAQPKLDDDDRFCPSKIIIDTLRWKEFTTTLPILQNIHRGSRNAIPN